LLELGHAVQQSRTFLAETLLLRLQRTQLSASGLSLLLQRQALLFEPNHAFHFGFIDYQETLKPHYQSHRNN